MPSRTNIKRSIPRHIIVTSLKDKYTINLESQKRKMTQTQRTKQVKTEFLSETMEVRRH